jgi:hypothetical protein
MSDGDERYHADSELYIPGATRRKKNTCGSGSRPTLFFLPTLLFFQHDRPCDLIFSRWLRAAHTACQNGVCCHTNYWTKLPKFHSKYASLVNIDVGTLLKIAQQKTAKTMKKIFKKKFISDLPTLIFSRYETGTTGIFFYAQLQSFDLWAKWNWSTSDSWMKVVKRKQF